MQELQNIKERFQKIHSSTNQQNKDVFGFELIYNMLEKFSNPGLYVIAGRPNIGKTSFIISLLENINYFENKKRQTGIISVDMSAQFWLARYLSNITEIWLEKISRGRLDNNELNLILNSELDKNIAHLNINDSAYLEKDELRDLLQFWKHEKDVQIIVVDSLNHIPLLNGSNADHSMFIFLSELKSISLNLNLPIIISTSIKPVNAKNYYQPLTLADFRSVGPIEQITEAIIFINKSDPVEANKSKFFERQDDEVYLCIAKNNFGCLESCRLKALTHIQKFVEYDYPYPF